jgi:hypothetical protein
LKHSKTLVCLTAAALTWSGAAFAAGPSKAPANGGLPADQRNFVACPIIKDTKTVPCWLAEYGGELYFLGIQTDAGGWPPPYLGHQVLVEGKVVQGPRVCGGIPLTAAITLPGASPIPSGKAAGQELPKSPVTSVMRELDSSCNTMLPMDPQDDVVGRRVPGPNVARLAPPPRPPAPPAPTPPFKAETFTLMYDFDSELAVLTINNTQRAIQYATATNAKRIEVVAYRGAAKLSNGQTIFEIPKIAELRAEEAAHTLRRLGIPQGTELKVTWKNEPVAVDGITDPEKRRTEIIVTP